MAGNDISQGRRAYLKTAGAAGVFSISGLAGCTVLPDTGGGGSETITIGGTVPLSGSFSSLGKEVEQGYRLGVQKMNEQLDQEVELVIQDDESDPEQVRQSLQLITSNNSVDMIWGSFASLLVTAGSAFAENQSIPFLGAFFAYEQPHRNEGYEWTFSPFPKSRDVARSTKGLLELIPENERPSRVGLWEPNTGWGSEQADYWEETLRQAGYEIVLRKKFQLGSEDFSSLISQSKNKAIEVLLSNPSPPGGITAMNQMEANDFAPQVLKFVRGADPAAWWSALGKKGAYACMCPGWVPGLVGNGNEEFKQSYADKHDLGEGKLIPVAVGGAYNVTQVTSQAVQAASSMDPADIRDALRSESFNTVIGAFSFESNGLPTEGELTAPTGQWWAGGQHTVYPSVDGEEAIDFQYPLQPWSER